MKITEIRITVIYFAMKNHDYCIGRLLVGWRIRNEGSAAKKRHSTCAKRSFIYFKCIF